MPGAENVAAGLSEDEVNWSALKAGDALTVVKLAPDGSEAARYPGTVIAAQDRGSWIVVQAVWTRRRIVVAGLTFSRGDTLREWFSPRHDFNAFSIHTAGGAFVGWYANVTHPARLDISASPSLLTWHDLYLDVIALPDGAATTCDEDELAASGLSQSDPPLHDRILRARDEILDRLARRIVPFGPGADPAP